MTMDGQHMEHLSDLELITNIQTGQNANDSLVELSHRHSGIYAFIVNKYAGNNEAVKNEILWQKEYTVYNTALKFDPERETKFSTYLGHETRWACLNVFSRLNKKSFLEEKVLDYNTEEVEESHHTSPEVFEIEAALIKERIVGEVLEKAKEHKDERIKKIFSMRYDTKNKKVTPWRKISKEVGLSIQGCINAHNNALKNLTKHIQFNNEPISELSH